ncbi:F0F1 ATP synthase subunit epsilon [Cereibacter sphaeroides]|uniref:F0F1 ATP synthase subunit epsilon n=1 Tax=Rhodobacterales TaxID=204455 RepID=UPI000BBE3F70|nr:MULTISPECIES: F0F1 ATP synthase subunit epsilon [Paracoccaceae]MCE6952076.1 F0F1 ATP synthase subunit epsilon [Cereibacter sphaeroides]MCE6961389.1 F0F1 ATP synthase subunit epsilon [Cereibacter sphaeroides]MCE6970375.1 F0F1 ATP synthase subunit epsilon [Cereibacter sphaeroides]MCE6973930.1 F0F1 ATP synthase subunit epsilon [Cereibacter sphaeroides]
MAGTLQFDLVSPERRLASFAATDVQIPGSEGDLTAMEGHAPTITSLRPGILRAHATTGMQSFAVTGGFAEINGTSVSVLAEKAVPVEELTGTVIDEFIAEARELASVALPEDKDMAERMVNDMIALKVAAGH